MRVMVTGAAGYIGSVLVRQLLRQGYSVLGVDSLMYGGESLIGVYNEEGFAFSKTDIRDYSKISEMMSGVDSVVHLAAIVGDPACAKHPELATAINWEGAASLLEAASKHDRVQRFIFASTCSNYGKMAGDSFITEDSPLNPISLYAELKVRFEHHLLSSSPRPDLIRTALRFSTVYGLSPRMRFDLTVNEFTRDAALGRDLMIFGEQFWRPYCHVEDLARSCLTVLEADPGKVQGEVFNVGDTSENYQKKMLAEELQQLLPDVVVKYVRREEDPRDYRVDFSKINKQLGYRISRTVPEGMKEVIRIINDGIISDPDAPKYKNT